MATHTPGEWLADPIGRLHRHEFGSGGLSLCYGGDIHSADGRLTIRATTDVSETEAAANARLICAAPDLLAACKEALTALGGNDPQDHAYDSPLCGRLRSAIDKAERS